MRLYQVQFERESYWVEAVSMMEAVSLWKQHVKREWGADYKADEEPDSVALIHEDCVIRAEQFIA